MNFETEVYSMYFPIKMILIDGHNFQADSTRH